MDVKDINATYDNNLPLLHDICELSKPTSKGNQSHPSLLSLQLSFSKYFPISQLLLVNVHTQFKSLIN